MADFNTRSKDLGYLVVIGGPGGSGASTIARKLVEHLSLDYLYGGKLMRSLAKENGFSSLTDFLRSDVFKKNNSEFDFLIDEKLFEKSFNKNILIDSKVFAALATKHEIPCSVKIWITADIDVRVSRTMGKEGIDACSLKVRENLLKRYEYDKERFKELYDIDFDMPEKYNDIVVDSSKQNPEQTFQFILKEIKDGRYF